MNVMKQEITDDIGTAPPDLERIRQTAAALAPAILRTPFLPSRTLSRLTGCDLSLKFENLQFTASFKERGALAKLLTLASDERRAGVCAMSAGNHAQGVAYHASRLGIAATIVMPEGTPLTKISRTRDHGATVVVHGKNLSEATSRALEIARDNHLTFIHPYADSAVIAGQGTLALEMLADQPDLDCIVVPIGGGGLISGIAIAAKAIKPTIRIVGVQSEAFPSMARAIGGDPTPCADRVTIAEGIAVKEAHPLTRAIIARLVDDIVEVPEGAIERAIADLLAIEKTVAEGAGAAALAAVQTFPDLFTGKRVAVPLTGGNIDLRILSSVALRALVRSGQLVRFGLTVNDQPGALAALATHLGAAGANIVELVHNRLATSPSPKGTRVEMLIEVQDEEHYARIIERLVQEGMSPERMYS